MIRKKLVENKSLLIWAILAGVLTSIIAIAPQIDLWIERGSSWNGSYAITDFDEPFYTAYLESIIDGKPRRNSPFTGVVDSPSNPQKESYLSIQFMAFYPSALVARIIGLSPAWTMILLGLGAGFLSAIGIYWLVYLFVGHAASSFVGTLVVVFGGAMAAAQGSLYNLTTNHEVHYLHSLIFLRRVLPAVGFPVLILFFVLIWKFMQAETRRSKIVWGVLSVGCLAVNVYSYFYYWTTAIAWFVGLILFIVIFSFQDFKKNWKGFATLTVGFAAVLIPYFFLLQNRSSDVDEALRLGFTHMPDLWRAPELISYAGIVLFIAARVLGWIQMSRVKMVFLLSFTLVAPAVFNQQILTGRVLQPFHYQFFSVNYLAVLSFVGLAFYLIGQRIGERGQFRVFSAVAITVLIIGIFDTHAGVAANRELNLWRDDLVPVADRLRIIAASKADKSPQVVMSDDFSNLIWPNGIDIPALTSQPVVWSVHQSMFPDVNQAQNIERLYKFLYYQDFDRKRLRDELFNKNVFLIYAFLGADRTSSLYSGRLETISREELDLVADNYEKFRQNFNYEDAREPEISFSIVNKYQTENLANLDRWYERDEGEEIGPYILYITRLRKP